VQLRCGIDTVASLTAIGYLSPRMAGSGELVRVTEADVERLAAQIGLAIAPESRAAVAQHLAGLLAAVQLIDELALPEATEPAPRFEP